MIRLIPVLLLSHILYRTTNHGAAANETFLSLQKAPEDNSSQKLVQKRRLGHPVPNVELTATRYDREWKNNT